MTVALVSYRLKCLTSCLYLLVNLVEPMEPREHSRL